MRWFTREWHQGDLSKAARTGTAGEYRAHLDALLFRSPGFLRPLAELNLHDARFLTVDVAQAHIVLHLIAGDLQSGYVRSTIAYEDATLVGVTPDDLTALVMTPDTEVLSDEIDVAGPGEYEQRFFLSSYGEFAIRFSSVEVTSTPASSDEYGAARSREDGEGQAWGRNGD